MCVCVYVQPENLMLVADDRMKIIDFGLARKLTDNVECREMLGTPEFVGKSVCFQLEFRAVPHWINYNTMLQLHRYCYDTYVVLLCMRLTCIHCSLYNCIKWKRYLDVVRDSFSPETAFGLQYRRHGSFAWRPSISGRRSLGMERLTVQCHLRTGPLFILVTLKTLLFQRQLRLQKTLINAL